MMNGMQSAMVRRRVRALLACVAVAGLAPTEPLPAQDDAAFVAAFAAFAAATGEAAVAAAAAASDQFLALPPGEARDRHLVAGVQVTEVAGRAAIAIDLALAARRNGSADARLVEHHLRALLATERFTAFVDQARLDRDSQLAALQTVLAANEARLLPLAERALRSGDTARGRFVFAELAAIAPEAPWRLANFALCLRQLGEVDAARAAYERGLAAWPDDLDLTNDFGLFLRGNGELVAAGAMFARSHALDVARTGDLHRRGPGITNLVHMHALHPDVAAPDPLPDARRALAVRPDAAMLARLVLDVSLDRLAPPPRRP
jgi:tetratricopeptide (TPR) repeat protein